MTVERTVRTTTTPAARVFDYLLDFENAAEWDSGTVSCERISGDGGLGTRYRNVSRFLGRETELVYTLEELVAGKHFVLVGENKTVTSRDTISVNSLEAGTAVHYAADFTFSGVARIVAPLLRPALDRLGDKTAAQLGRSLDLLPERT